MLQADAGRVDAAACPHQGGMHKRPRLAPDAAGVGPRIDRGQPPSAIEGASTHRAPQSKASKPIWEVTTYTARLNSRAGWPHPHQVDAGMGQILSLESPGRGQITSGCTLSNTAPMVRQGGLKHPLNNWHPPAQGRLIDPQRIDPPQGRRPRGLRLHRGHLLSFCSRHSLCRARARSTSAALTVLQSTAPSGCGPWHRCAPPTHPPTEPEEDASAPWPPSAVLPEMPHR